MNRLKRLSKTLRSNYWNIGFVEEDIRDVLKSERLNIHWLNHPYKDRWFADPYFLSVDDEKIVLLVEEFSYKLQRGRIAKLIINRDGYRLADMKVILDLPTHLSFPVVYRQNGNIYIMPENCHSDATKMYEYNYPKDEMTVVSKVSSLPLTDATIVEMPNGKQYIFSTKEPTQNGNHLQIYSFDQDKKAMNEIPLQDVAFESNVARNAGDAFWVDGVMYRPSQDCNQCYGNGICIQRVEYDGEKFSFSDVTSFHSDYPLFDMGYHTFNMMNGLIVIDAHGHRFKKANRLMETILRIYGFIKRH